MRRKVLQSYANVFCQHFIDLGSGSDAEVFADFGSGTYKMDILGGVCSKDGTPIVELKVCRHFREWLLEQMRKDRVPPGVEVASLVVNMTVSNVSVKESYGHVFGAADFVYECHSEIRTDERAYVCALSGRKRWGYTPSAMPRYGR